MHLRHRHSVGLGVQFSGRVQNVAAREAVRGLQEVREEQEGWGRSEKLGEGDAGTGRHRWSAPHLRRQRPPHLRDMSVRLLFAGRRGGERTSNSGVEESRRSSGRPGISAAGWRRWWRATAPPKDPRLARLQSAATAAAAPTTGVHAKGDPLKLTGEKRRKKNEEEEEEEEE